MTDKMTAIELKNLSIGDAVALPDGADSYPDFFIRESMTGRISEINDDCVWITIDRHYPELDE